MSLLCVTTCCSFIFHINLSLGCCFRILVNNMISRLGRSCTTLHHRFNNGRTGNTNTTTIRNRLPTLEDGIGLPRHGLDLQHHIILLECEFRRRTVFPRPALLLLLLRGDFQHRHRSVLVLAVLDRNKRRRRSPLGTARRSHRLRGASGFGRGEGVLVAVAFVFVVHRDQFHVVVGEYVFDFGGHFVRQHFGCHFEARFASVQSCSFYGSVCCSVGGHILSR
mmetsp:Transcript_29530/g.63600  ORF Transcript_29530/g.63600 Transcript_29530/m.63600 type:complete len:222 (+) Transcript_29530:972-1637(+)